MLEPWKKLTLLPPPVNMFLCETKFDVSALKHVFNNIIKVLSNQSPLHKESAICSRFIYKYGRKFRNDIGYQNLRKVNTALKKYLTLNLLKQIENFLLSLPTESDEDLYLPTRQMLEFVLLRIIAFSKIMLRVCVYSKKAAVFYLNRIKRGESHWMSLLPYALLSRLWSMSKVLLQHATTWYSNLYPYLQKLQLKGMNFLPDNYKLPEDLEQWLDLKNLDEFGRFNWAEKKIIDIDHTLIDSDDNDLFDNILGYINQINEDQAESDQEEDMKPVTLLEKRQEVPIPVPTVTKIDHGVALSRESFKSLLNSNKLITKDNRTPTPAPPVKPIEHSHEKITNSSSLKKFIDREEQFRNESDDSKSLTRHLSFMQWHALKNALLKLCDKHINRKIDKKFHKIWKQKCLDYM